MPLVPASQPAMDSAKMHVTVSPSVYKMVWCGVALFYSVCACYLVGQAIMYFYIPVKAISLMGNLELLSIGVSRNYYPTIAGTFIAIAAVHVFSLFDMVLVSLRHRRLMFTSSHRIACPTTRRVTVQPVQQLAGSSQAVLRRRPSHLRRLVKLIGSSMLSLWRAFGVTNPNYGVVYVTREIIQTVIQTYQAYRLSSLVARAWMNRVVVILLVLNCWTTPIIQFLPQSSLGSTRLMCLVVNLALDFVSYIVFPLALFLPYYANFDPMAGNFAQNLWYSDVWIIQVVNEWQMLFITSVWDALSRFFIAYNITRSLHSIPRLLRSKTRYRTRSRSFTGRGSLLGMPNNVTAIVPTSLQNGENPGGTAHTTPAGIQGASAAAIVPVNQQSAQKPDENAISGTNNVETTPDDKMSQRRRRMEHVGHIILAVWGLGVLTAHIQSAITRDNRQCLVQVRPWFTTRPVCSLMEINCHDSKLHGHAKDFDQAIATIESEWLAHLIVRHCDAVEITPHIHNLPWLMAFKVYNSTLIRWDEDAALTNTDNPRMLFVFMAAIKAQAVPSGLYAHDFPQKLHDIELSDWNVTSLPDEIVDMWPSGMFLVIEKFQFSVFPDALAKLRPECLSISYNNFSELPTEFWENDELVFLNLNGNPIATLPAQIRSPRIFYLSIVATEIAQLPSWINSQTVRRMKLKAGSTPFCSSLFEGNGTALSLSGSEMRVMQHFVNCTPALPHHYLTHYPLENESINNP